MAEQPEVGVVSQVNEDGATEVSETTMPSNYEVETKELVGEIPPISELGDLSTLFEPRYQFIVNKNVRLIYKKADPGTLMLTLGSPIGVDIDLESINEKQSRLTELQEKLKLDADEGTVLEQEDLLEINEILNSDEMKELTKREAEVTKATIQACVLAPKINDEAYDRLPQDLKRKLYEKITGGITSDNTLVETFR